MIRIERVWDQKNRTAVLLISGVIMVLVALLDWWTKAYISLGFLYLFPIMLAAAFLPRWATVGLAVSSAILAELFSSLARSYTRLGLEILALTGCGLFIAELVRNRRMMLETQERLRALVETSPAAIVTVDDHGFIDLANHAAIEMMAPRDGRLAGMPVAAFMPDLHHALQGDDKPQFRTSMQCLVHRGNGETFNADVWFSTYKEGTKPKLAAIITEVSEESADGDLPPTPSDQQISMSSRETEVLRLLVQGLANKAIAAQMGISESAVKNTLQLLFAKIGVRTRSQLVRVALEKYREFL